jgi:hypothetical protein
MKWIIGPKNTMPNAIYIHKNDTVVSKVISLLFVINRNDIKIGVMNKVFSKKTRMINIKPAKMKIPYMLYILNACGGVSSNCVQAMKVIAKMIAIKSPLFKNFSMCFMCAS